jgi:hypothetical protein
MCSKHRVKGKILPQIRYNKPITPRTKIVTGNKINTEYEGKKEMVPA